MNTTKDKILDAALTLFNREGCQSITVRQLATEVGISHGNLCYHYPTVDEVIYKLYERWINEQNKRFDAIQDKNVSLEFLFETGRSTFEIAYQYRFLLLDFVGIMRQQPRIKEHFQELVKKRVQEIKVILSHMKEHGIIHEERYPGQYEHIAEVTMIVGDFWISRAEILYSGNEMEKLMFYMQVVFAPIMALYTEKGREEGFALLEKLKQRGFHEKGNSVISN